MPKIRKTAEKEQLTIEQVVSQSGISERTLRRWTRAGVFQGPIGNSRASHYERSHVLRARAIQALRGEGLTMRAIRDRLSVASAKELERLAAPARPPSEAVPAAPSAPSYPATAWELLELSDSLVLMVRADREGARRLADEIYRHYRS